MKYVNSNAIKYMKIETFIYNRLYKYCIKHQYTA